MPFAFCAIGVCRGQSGKGFEAASGGLLFSGIFIPRLPACQGVDRESFRRIKYDKKMAEIWIFGLEKE